MRRTEWAARLLAGMFAASSMFAAAASVRAQTQATGAGRMQRVRDAGVVRCGAALRPGLAFPGEDHELHGVLVDLCRAVAVAVAGPEARTVFTGYAAPADFARAQGADDLAFLTGSEVFAQALAEGLQPGPAVVFVSTGVMVAPDSPVRRLADLAGTTVCAEPGTAPERALLSGMAARAIGFRFSGWQETEEMLDAFAAGRCPAVVGEMPALAALRLGRVLEEPLAVSPVLAMTGREDGPWSATVGWVLQGVLTGEAMPGAGLGLAPGWRGRSVAAVGSYEAIIGRWMGPASALRLPAGPNQGWRAGGLLAPPGAE